MEHKTFPSRLPACSLCAVIGVNNKNRMFYLCVLRFVKISAYGAPWPGEAVFFLGYEF